MPQRLILHHFKEAGLRPPDGVHKGFFGSLPDAEYPSPIAFALLDSDLYSSTHDSLVKIYSKMSVGGVILVHDFGPNSELTPGAMQSGSNPRSLCPSPAPLSPRTVFTCVARFDPRIGRASTSPPT